MSYSKGNVTFNSVRIGDMAWIESSYSGNVTTRIIPKALGVRILSTSENGGGMKNLVVRAWVIKTTRKALEDYIESLRTSLGHGPSTLSSDGSSYSNCYLSRISLDPGYSKFGFFTVEFIQSI